MDLVIQFAFFQNAKKKDTLWWIPPEGAQNERLLVELQRFRDESDRFRAVMDAAGFPPVISDGHYQYGEKTMGRQPREHKYRWKPITEVAEVREFLGRFGRRLIRVRVKPVRSRKRVCEESLQPSAEKKSRRGESGGK